MHRYSFLAVYETVNLQANELHLLANLPATYVHQSVSSSHFSTDASKTSSGKLGGSLRTTNLVLILSSFALPVVRFRGRRDAVLSPSVPSEGFSLVERLSRA